jgi:hypothetical protein
VRSRCGLHWLGTMRARPRRLSLMPMSPPACCSPGKSTMEDGGRGWGERLRKYARHMYDGQQSNLSSPPYVANQRLSVHGGARGRARVGGGQMCHGWWDDLLGTRCLSRNKQH